MKKKQKLGIGAFTLIGLITISVLYLHKQAFPVLQPAGAVAHSERNLIIIAATLSLAVIIPVFGLLGAFLWKYRETNTKATYTPELGGSKLAETIWWLVPTVLIGIIAVMTWQSSYSLDPFKRLASSKPTMHVQVVAMDWKWLFIYPDQHIASVNEVALPVGTPVEFELTSDTVMNSFWIPKLGGQMYAMPGMTTELNLVANKPGVYRGNSANISGRGFARMNFNAKAMDMDGFNAWAKRAKTVDTPLSMAAYTRLTKPSESTPVSYYSSVSPAVYSTTVMKYMMPIEGTNE